MGPRGAAGPPGKNGEDVSRLDHIHIHIHSVFFFQFRVHIDLFYPLIPFSLYSRVSLASLVALVSADPPAHR